MSETPLSIRGIVKDREIHAITGYAKGMREPVIASSLGYTTPSNMRIYTHRAYQAMGVPDMLGATKTLIEAGEIDPVEIAKGHNLTSFNRLLPGELQLVDFVANFPANKVLTAEEMEEAAKSFRIGGLFPGSSNERRVYQLVGAHNRPQLVVLYKAYQNLMSQGMDRDYTESDFPKNEDVESKVFYARRMDHITISQDELLTLKIHMVGALRSQTGVTFPAASSESAEHEELRVTKGLVTKHRMTTFFSIRKLHQAKMLNIEEFTGGRDLLRFKTVSQNELSELESLIQAQASTSVRETSYEDLRKKFGVATNDHLAVLFYAYKSLYPDTQTPQKESLVGKVITDQQAEIVRLSAQGKTRYEIMAQLGYKRRQFRNIIQAIGGALGLEREEGDNQNATLIGAANLLMDSGDINYKSIAKNHDLTLFDRLLPSNLSILEQLARGETTFRTLDGRPFTPQSIRINLNQLHLKTGALSRTHLIALYRAYREQKIEPPAEKPGGVKITEEYLKAATMPEAVTNAGYAPSSRPMILDRIYREKGVSNQSQLILKLASEGSLNLKEIAGEYSRKNPKFQLSNFERLNARELEIANLLSQGLSVTEIASALTRSFDNTTKSIVQINRKLGTDHREQILAYFLLYQYPNSWQEAARNTDQPSALDIIGIQAVKLRIKGLDEAEIAKVLNISQERLSNYTDRLSVALGTPSDVETLIELHRLGRIDTFELVRNYRIQDFSLLSDSQIGIMEVLASQDPRRYLTYLEKLSFYLQQPEEEIERRLKEVQLYIGLTPEGAASLHKKDLLINEIEQPATQEPTDIMNEEAAVTTQQPLSERQVRFGEEIYEPYLEKIFDFVDRRLRDHAESQEVAQEVFITAFNNIDSTTEEDFKALSWLYSIAQNKIRQAIDQRTKAALVPHDSEIHDFAAPAGAENTEATTGLNFQPIGIDKLTILYMEYRKRLRENPMSLLSD